MLHNGRGYFICRIRKLERERARYHANMKTPAGRAQRSAKWRRQMEKRRNDPAHKLYKQLYEMTQVRVRY